MNSDLTNKTILVTGASRGIGRAIAVEFSNLGARVAIHFHQNKDAAEETLSFLSGSDHLLVQQDLSRFDDLEKLSADLFNKTGGIDVLVNNAGIYISHPVETSTFESWRISWENTINTNLLGPAHLSFAMARQMIKNGGGKIINITSRGAFRGEPTAPAYGTSKAGLNAFSQSMAQALAPHNIFVYAVAPGFVDAGMAADVLSSPEGDSIRAQSPMGRAAKAEEVARAAAFLACEGTDYMTGCIIDVNGASYLRS